jgi:hypothetical protein
MQYVAIWGGLIQAASGAGLVFGVRRFVWVAILGLGLSWVYYGPAVVISMLSIRRASGTAILAFIPPLILAYTTISAVRYLMINHRPA